MGDLQELGYLGLFIAAFLAATVVPFSSDILFVGFLALGYNMFLSLGVATIGNWLGSLTTYWIGYAGNAHHIEKWFHVSLKKIKSRRTTIEKYGSWLALLVWIPFIGDIFAIALGFYKINFKKSATSMLIGKFFRFVIMCLAFYFFQKTKG